MNTLRTSQPSDTAKQAKSFMQEVLRKAYPPGTRTTRHVNKRLSAFRRTLMGHEQDPWKILSRISPEKTKGNTELLTLKTLLETIIQNYLQPDTNDSTTIPQKEKLNTVIEKYLQEHSMGAPTEIPQVVKNAIISVVPSANDFLRVTDTNPIKKILLLVIQIFLKRFLKRYYMLLT